MPRGKSAVEVMIDTLYNNKGARQATEDFKKMEGEFNKLRTSLRGSKGFSFSDSFSPAALQNVKGFAVALGAVGASALAAGIAIKQALDFGAEGAQVERIEDSFYGLTEAAGVSGDALLAALDKAARGTISNTDLILSTNRAMMLGLGADADQLSNLMEVAAFRGRAMGLSTTQAFNDIVTGVGRASPMILDNLGIIVDAEATYEKYAESIGKAKDELTKAEKTQALLTRVIEEGNAQIAAAGGYADDTAASYERMNASWKNFSDAFKKSAGTELAPTAERLSGIFDDLEESVKDNGAAITVFNFGLNDLVKTIAEASGAMDRLRENSQVGRWAPAGALRDLAKGVKEVDNAFEIAIVSSRNYIEAAALIPLRQSNLKAAMEESTPSIEDQEKAFKELKSSIDDAINSQNQLFSGQISDIRGIAGDRISQEEQENDLLEKRNKLQAELTQAEIAQSIALRTLDQTRTGSDKDNRARQSAIADYEKGILTITELKGQINAVNTELMNMGQAASENFNQMVYDALQAKLAADGVTTEAEQLYLLNQGKQLGIYQQADIDLWQQINDQAATLASQAPQALTPLEQGFLAVKEPMQSVLDIMEKMRAMNGTVVNFGVNFATMGGIPALPMITSGGPVTGRHEQRSFGGGFADGGSFTVPGTGSGDRPFVVGLTPGETVDVYPKGEGRQVMININIENVRSLSDLDYLAQEVEKRMTALK